LASHLDAWVWSGETHWETIEQGHECALRVLRALRDKADIDTSESVRQLLVQWEALERFGDFAFDHTPKVCPASPPPPHALTTHLLLLHLLN
jgi:hypothetical protein